MNIPTFWYGTCSDGPIPENHTLYAGRILTWRNLAILAKIDSFENFLPNFLQFKQFIFLSCVVLSTQFSDYYILYAYMLCQFRKTKPQHVNNSQVSKVSVRLAPGGWSGTVPLIWSPPGYLHTCIALMGSLVRKGPVPEDKPPFNLPTYLPNNNGPVHSGLSPHIN